MPQLVLFVYQTLAAVLQRDYVRACRNFRVYSALAALLYYASVFLIAESILGSIVQTFYIVFILVPFGLRVALRLVRNQRVVVRACGWSDHLSDGIMVGTLVYFLLGDAFPPVPALGLSGEELGWIAGGGTALVGAWASRWFSRPGRPGWVGVPKVPKPPKRPARAKRNPRSDRSGRMSASAAGSEG